MLLVDFFGFLALLLVVFVPLYSLYGLLFGRPRL